MVLAIVVVVVAVIVVAVPIVVYAVHDNHPFLRDPFPRTKRTNMPHRHGRPSPVARMARDMAAGDTGRRRMVTRLQTGVSMPCDGRWIDMTSWSGMLHRVGPGCWSRSLSDPRRLRCDRPGRRSCGLRRPRWLRRPCRASAGAVVSASRRSECRCAECCACNSDECEFHEVRVHSAPSLSVRGSDGEPISPLHQARSPSHPFLTRAK